MTIYKIQEKHSDNKARSLCVKDYRTLKSCLFAIENFLADIYEIVEPDLVYLDNNSFSLSCGKFCFTAGPV